MILLFVATGLFVIPGSIGVRIEEKNDCPPEPGKPRDIEIVVDKDRNGWREHRVRVQFFAENMRFQEPPHYDCH